MPGISKLDAVNHLLRSIGEPPYTVLPSTGSDTTSMGARAEDVLDRVSQNVQIRGGADNVRRYQTFTPVGNEVTLASTVLWIESCGSSLGRQFVIRGGKVYDQVLGSSTIGSGTIQLHVHDEIAWDDMSAAAKATILGEAVREFQMFYRGNARVDAYLAGESAKGETVATAPKNQAPRPPLNLSALTLPRSVSGEGN